MIKLERVNKTYHDADRELSVIESLSFNFPESGSIAIVGKSGCGKSTLLHLLGGLDTLTSGKIFYDNLEISALNSNELSRFRGERIGFIFQFHHLLSEFSALENVAMPLLIQGISENVAISKSKRVLDLVGLSDRTSHRPGALSGGEQQRVAIARAVVGEPRVILADEPTGNLDHNTALVVQELLLELNRSQESLMVLVTHNNDLAKSMDVVYEMLPGGILEERK